MPPPTPPLTVIWKPNYTCTTAYSQDTIRVQGDTTDTDEWDDDVLLHEFGHYLMDTALADSLGMGLDEIWKVFDNYDPPGNPFNCWTVFQFCSGWNNQGHDHQPALDQILLHHRIEQWIPGVPVGLRLLLEGGFIRIYWAENPEPDVCGYRVYRRDCVEGSGAFVEGTEWQVIDEVSDTTCLDTTGQFGIIDYEYAVTAFDELGSESGFSSSVVTPAAGVDGAESVVGAPVLAIGPNPTGGGLRIGWAGDRVQSDFSLKIYDPTGRLVRDLSRAGGDAKGRTEVAWEGNDDRGHRVPPGIYFVRLELNGDKATAKAIILR